MAEDGRIDERYRLVELASPEYGDRTRKNVEDSDGTLILNREKLEGGTALTLVFANNLNKPVMLVDLDNPPEPHEIGNWFAANEIKQCNVAGPRESKRGVFIDRPARFLQRLLASPDIARLCHRGQPFLRKQSSGTGMCRLRTK